ncbi:uncharacterized protein LOC123671420 [Harmonia axyridis]|uniref:uncharacterized protein LOC123671420 n=1 Tax=Harmonia axyridis TaxID=115357 RepID=UPI001E276565|nr:uncharacterized protein LOC123671420 [Harmonia axyridis]
MNVKNFLTFSFVFMIIFLVTDGFHHRHFHTLSSTNCPDETKPLVVTIKSFHTKIFNFGQKVITEIVYEVEEPLNDLKMTAQISRCNYTKSSICELYLEKATITDICEIIEMEDTAWTAYLQTFNPPISKCPIEPGNFTSRYASEKTDMIDLSAWFSDGLWQIQNILYSGDQKVGCFITEIEIYTPEQEH